MIEKSNFLKIVQVALPTGILIAFVWLFPQVSFFTIENNILL